MGLSAGQDGGVGLPTADGEVVHTQHARRAGLRVGQRHDSAQQGHTSHPEAQLGGQPSACPSGECEPDTLQDVIEPRSEARIWSSQLRERLGERAARAVVRAADEAPDLQVYHDTLLSER